MKIAMLSIYFRSDGLVLSDQSVYWSDGRVLSVFYPIAADMVGHPCVVFLGKVRKMTGFWKNITDELMIPF